VDHRPKIKQKKWRLPGKPQKPELVEALEDMLMASLGGSEELLESVTRRAAAVLGRHNGDGKTCHVCGCTEDRACVDEFDDCCSWAAPGLCTFCAQKLEAESKLT